MTICSFLVISINEFFPTFDLVDLGCSGTASLRKVLKDG